MSGPVKVAIVGADKESTERAKRIIERRAARGLPFVLPKGARMEIVSAAPAPAPCLTEQNYPAALDPRTMTIGKGRWPAGRVLTVDELRPLDAATPYDAMTQGTRRASYLLFPERLDAA